MVVAKEKINYRIDIDSDVSGAMDELFKRRGVGRSEGMTRMMRWFLDAPESVQQDMLEQLPEDLRPNIARLVYEYMLERGERADTGPAGSIRPGHQEGGGERREPPPRGLRRAGKKAPKRGESDKG